MSMSRRTISSIAGMLLALSGGLVADQLVASTTDGTLSASASARTLWPRG
jgi:hypothetical protein